MSIDYVYRLVCWIYMFFFFVACIISTRFNNLTHFFCGPLIFTVAFFTWFYLLLSLILTYHSSVAKVYFHAGYVPKRRWFVSDLSSQGTFQTWWTLTAFLFSVKFRRQTCLNWWNLDSNLYGHVCWVKVIVHLGWERKKQVIWFAHRATGSRIVA